jgi:hemolysin D
VAYIIIYLRNKRDEMYIFRWLKKKSNKMLDSSETEFLPAVVEIMETPPSPAGRTVLWTIIGLVVIALVWSIIGEIDEVAVAPGKLIPIGNVKVIQAEDKGVVKSILVKEGQIVSKGQVMLELDPLFSAADLAKIKKEHAFYSLEAERLLAEREGRAFIPSGNQELDPKDVSVQMQLYYSRASEYKTKVSAAQAAVYQSEANLEAARINEQKYDDQLGIALEKERRIEKLVDQNAVAYFQLLDQRAKRMELERDLAAQREEVARCASAALQARHNLGQISAEHETEISTKLIDARKQVFANGEELKKAEEKNKYTSILSPIDGRVSQLSVHTIGGVVNPAQTLMMVVPEDVPIVAEVWIANKDIGFVQAGQSVEIKVETYNFQKFGTVSAVVTQISPDATEDKEKGLVYRAELAIIKNNINLDGNTVYLSPGMAVSAEIKTQRKRIIEFFLEPFRKYRSEAFRER